MRRVSACRRGGADGEASRIPVASFPWLSQVRAGRPQHRRIGLVARRQLARLPDLQHGARRRRHSGRGHGAPRPQTRADCIYGAREPAYAAADIMSSSDSSEVTTCMGALAPPFRDFVLKPAS